MTGRERDRFAEKLARAERRTQRSEMTDEAVVRECVEKAFEGRGVLLMQWSRSPSSTGTGPSLAYCSRAQVESIAKEAATLAYKRGLEERT